MATQKAPPILLCPKCGTAATDSDPETGEPRCPDCRRVWYWVDANHVRTAHLDQTFYAETKAEERPMGRDREDTMNLNQLAHALTPLIPEDWKLEISFFKDEVSINMYDPDGNRIEDWPDDLTTNEIALWYVNYARRREGLPPGIIPGLRYESEDDR